MNYCSSGYFYIIFTGTFPGVTLINHSFTKNREVDVASERLRRSGKVHFTYRGNSKSQIMFENLIHLNHLI